MLPRGVQHMRASGVSLFFHHLSHHPMTLASGRLRWCFCLFVCLLLLCFVLCWFPVLQVSYLDDRQGFTASSAVQ